MLTVQKYGCEERNQWTNDFEMDKVIKKCYYV